MKPFHVALYCLVASLFVQTTVFAADPVTTTDPTISVTHLKLRLKPLTQEELLVETEGWRTLLQQQATAISDLSIRMDEATAELKPQLAEELSGLQEERTRLADRTRAAMGALAGKGGDVEAYQQYLDTVTRVEVNTEDMTGAVIALRNWTTSKEGGIRVGTNILKFLAILFIAQIVASISGRVTRRALARTKLSDLLKNFTANAVRKVVLLLGLLVALSALGINTAPLLAGVGVVGFVVGFALQDTLSNFASGFMILLYRPYDVGDVVEAGGVNGIVDDMTLVSTRIKTFDNQVVTVPNSSIWGGTITNATGSSTRRVDMTFGIGYSDDLAKAERVLTEIVQSQPEVLKDPATTIQLHELADSSVNFVVRPWVKTEDYWTVHWNITRAVKERFDAEAISIPFPQHDVHVHQVT